MDRDQAGGRAGSCTTVWPWPARAQARSLYPQLTVTSAHFLFTPNSFQAGRVCDRVRNSWGLFPAKQVLQMCAGIIEGWLTVPHGSTSLPSLDPASAMCGWPSCLPRLLCGGRQELSSSTHWESGTLPTPPLPREVGSQSLQFPWKDWTYQMSPAILV